MNLKHLFFASAFFLSTFLTFLSGAPIVAQVTPNAGPQAGGTVVSILGTGFTGTTAVNFGNTPAASFIVNSDNQITAISPASVFGTVNVTVTTASGISPIVAGDRFVFQGTWLGYVTTETVDQAIPFTIPGNVVGTPISLAGTVPVDIAITPDGSRAYISTVLQGVKVIDILTNTVIATIPVGTAPIGVAITPDGTKVFVANVGGLSVSVIDTATNTVIATIPMDGDPYAVAITPDGTTAYVSINSPASSVIAINVATNTIAAAIPLGGAFDIRFVTVNPNGQSLYVGRETPGPLFVINIPTNTIATTIPLSVPTDGLFRVAVTPDGTKGLATTLNGTDSNIYPLDLITNTAGTPFAITGTPQGIAITPDGVTAYVANQGTEVFPIDVATNTVGAPLIVTGNSVYIAITPDQAPLATFLTMNGPGTTIFFDASDSVSPVGTIVSYAWVFGDGQTLVTSSPFTSHTYATNGAFNVTLVVTNSAGTSIAQTFPGTTMLQNGGVNAIFTQLVNVGIGPIPPSNFIGHQVKNIFATQTDLINQLTWQQSSDLTIIGYFIRRNGVIIANIPAQGPFFFLDHNRRKNEIDVYTLTTFSAGGESAPQTLILP